MTAASAGKTKAGRLMAHSVSGWMRDVQVKLWDPLRTRAIRLRKVCSRRGTIQIHAYLYLYLYRIASALTVVLFVHIDQSSIADHFDKLHQKKNVGEVLPFSYALNGSVSVFLGRLLSSSSLAAAAACFALCISITVSFAILRTAQSFVGIQYCNIVQVFRTEFTPRCDQCIRFNLQMIYNACASSVYYHL